MRKILSLICTLFIFTAVCACGISASAEIDGSWALSTVNGVTLLQYSAVLGTDVQHTAKVLEISGSKMITASVYGEEITEIEPVRDGFYEVHNGVRGIFASYDSEKNTITVSDEQFTYVFVRGGYDFTESA